MQLINYFLVSLTYVDQSIIKLQVQLCSDYIASGFLLINLSLEDIKRA